ncbi:MAG TPA: 2-dehydropantoate 2-reductase N-terminal domain-containing protein [Anaerolineae bacterium]|nr:2-dehydropantoate 2-reductase N-terminal domain-containing protein [Anaerolineae bacterium]
MKVLFLGAGVIGTTYAWQLATAGHDVTLLVRPGTREKFEREGVRIRCKDERQKPATTTDVTFQPKVVDELRLDDGYELIIVSVRAHQLDTVLPMLAAGAGQADVLFFGNNWWGDERMRQHLPADRYFFGFSRLVGGWRTGNQVDCIIFSTPGLETMLGEKYGQPTARLQNLVEVFKQAKLKPATSPYILGWLAVHYVEFLGAIGGIRKAGSVKAFAADGAIVTQAILATREGFQVCQARGIDLRRAGSLNVRLINALPIPVTRMLVQRQYQSASIQQFFEENIEHGMEELRQQYADVVAEGRRLGVKMSALEAFEPYFAQQ